MSGTAEPSAAKAQFALQLPGTQTAFTPQPQITQQQQLMRAIRLGFSVVLTLTVILGGMGLYQLNSVNASLSKIVTVHNNKIALAQAMRDAIRLRSLCINKMLATDDYFKRDEQVLNFYDYARLYREAREQLMALGMDGRETAIFEKLTRHAMVTQPLVRNVAELLMERDLPTNFSLLLADATEKQEQLLELLDESIELQKTYANQALFAAQLKFEYTMATFILVFSVLLIIGIVIARVVVHYVGNKNQALAQKNFELQKARTAADEATRAKSEFLANISHEIRTPLTTIIGFSETLADTRLSDKERQRAVLAMRNSGKHLYDIINDVLDLAKIEAGKLEIESIAVSPLAVVKQTLSMIEDKAADRGLQVQTNFQLPMPKTIVSDPMRLRQILLNLCANAVKFTEAGGITVTVGFNAQTRHMRFTVSDTGIGMTQEQVNRVFTPFHQGDKSTSRFYGGTGLGLSISKQLAKRLGGDIQCISEVGKGTTFIVSVYAGDQIPGEWVNETDTDIEITGPAARQEATPKLSGKVLLAEDTPEIQALITWYLEKAGLEVVAVGNGIEALKEFSRNRYDLVIMDMQMPLMDGLTAIKLMRSRGLAQPIVALTANAAREDKNRCLDAGADDFLVKPIDVTLFYALLSRYLSASGTAACEQNPLSASPRQPQQVDEEMQHLINGFVNRLPQTVNEITRAYRQKKWQDLLTSVHRLKGAGGAFGYPELSDISKKIMEKVKEHNDGGLQELVDMLNEQCRQITKKAG